MTSDTTLGVVIGSFIRKTFWRPFSGIVPGKDKIITYINRISTIYAGDESSSDMTHSSFATLGVVIGSNIRKKFLAAIFWYNTRKRLENNEIVYKIKILNKKAKLSGVNEVQDAERYTLEYLLA